jgi:hypothetical protein
MGSLRYRRRIRIAPGSGSTSTRSASRQRSRSSSPPSSRLRTPQPFRAARNPMKHLGWNPRRTISSPSPISRRSRASGPGGWRRGRMAGRGYFCNPTTRPFRAGARFRYRGRSDATIAAGRAHRQALIQRAVPTAGAASSRPRRPWAVRTPVRAEKPGERRGERPCARVASRGHEGGLHRSVPARRGRLRR